MNRRKIPGRVANFEAIEPRCLMAADMAATEIAVSASCKAVDAPVATVYLKATEANQASDINDDGNINHHDAVGVLHFIEFQRGVGTGGAMGEGEQTLTAQDADVNGDGAVSPSDVLWIVNQIRQYDPLTPCDCGGCSQPGLSQPCENRFLGEIQSLGARTTERLS